MFNHCNHDDDDDGDVYDDADDDVCDVDDDDDKTSGRTQVFAILLRRSACSDADSDESSSHADFNLAGGSDG